LLKVRVLESFSTADLSIIHRRYKYFRSLLLVVLALVLGAEQPGWLFAQEETTRGKVAGFVRDAAGAPVSGANVQVISRLRDTRYELKTDGNGHYESTWLQQGQYAMRIEARNFLVDHFVVDVKIGATANGDRSLTPINPGPPTLQSRVNPDQIGSLPIDGRDAQNVAKFEPEVLLEDAGRLDATKTGSFATSIDKISGLDSRYTLDGVEMNDETHGDVTQNIALSSVKEIALTQSMRDASTGLSSSGAVLMTTRSGAEGYHGEGFGFFRNSGIGFAAEAGKQNPDYQRQDFGGRFGGGLLQNKLFFFVAAERVHQDAKQAVIVPFPLEALTGRFSAPYRNTSGSGRLDWKFSDNLHAFYRFAYNLNSSIDNFGQGYAV